MLHKGELVNLIESNVQKYGGNKKVAYEEVGKQILENIQMGKVNARSISFRGLLEACLQEAGYPEVPWGDNKSDTEELREAVGASSFPNITKYIISNEIIPPYEVRKQKLEPLYSEGTSSRSDVERIAGFTAKEGLEYVPEQGTVQYTDFHEKYVEVRLGKFQRAMGLSKEAIYNDNTGQIIDRASNVGNAFGEQLEEFLIQTIEMRPRSLLAWETTTNLQAANFEGTSVTNTNFYSTDHSSLAYMGLQTNSNKLTSALSTDGLKDAYLLFPEMTDEEGTKIAVEPKTILVHPAKAMIAWQLTRSIGQYDTSNNAKNPWGPGGMNTFNVVVSSFINTNTDWYMGDFKKQVKLLYWEKPNVISQGKDSNQSFTNDIVMAWRASVGMGAAHADYRFIAYSDAAT